MAFTWILVLSVLQFLTEPISAGENQICGDLSPKYIFLLSPPSSEFSTLSKFLGTVKSATLIQNSEDGGIVQVYSDPIDWEKIYRYTVDRGFYFSHAARCIEKSEFSVFEHHRLHGSKFRNLGVNSVNQVPAEGRGANGGKDDSGSEGIAELGEEERFQRIARAASRKTDDALNRTGIKTKSNEKDDTKGKRKSTGSKKSARKPVSKTGGRRAEEKPNSPSGDGITEETGADRKGRLTKQQNRNKAKEENVGSEANNKRAKSRSRRDVTDPDPSVEHVAHLRAARQESEDDETTDETDANANDEKVRRQSISTRVPGGRNSKNRKVECKKGSKRQGCKTLGNARNDDDDEDAETAERSFDDVDETTDAIDAADGRHYHLWNSHEESEATSVPEGLGKLADYIHRIFSWIKELEISNRRG